MVISHSLETIIASIITILFSTQTLHFGGAATLKFGDVLPKLEKENSTLPNQSVDLEFLQKLVDELTARNALVRIDHIGFCYRVESKEEEKQRLKAFVASTEFHLYEEQSNDEGLWLFIADAQKWKEPAVELIPIERTKDKNASYWLPHIQIDLDTTLDAKEIVELVAQIYGSRFQPYPIVIDGVTYIVRNRLGVADGVNIFLDLATNARNVQYTRQNLWKVIV